MIAEGDVSISKDFQYFAALWWKYVNQQESSEIRKTIRSESNLQSQPRPNSSIHSRKFNYKNGGMSEHSNNRSQFRQMDEPTYNGSTALPNQIPKSLSNSFDSVYWKTVTGFYFFDIKGETTRNSRSFVNFAEINAIRKLIGFLSAFRVRDIGVISPYKAQVMRLRRALGDERRKGFGLEINTIDGFQGKQKDVIIISSVKSLETNRSRFGNTLF